MFHFGSTFFKKSSNYQLCQRKNYQQAEILKKLGKGNWASLGDMTTVEEEIYQLINKYREESSIQIITKCKANILRATSIPGVKIRYSLQ